MTLINTDDYLGAHTESGFCICVLCVICGLKNLPEDEVSEDEGQHEHLPEQPQLPSK
jgi:hypothetical protein